MTCRVTKELPQKNFQCPHCGSREPTPRQLSWHLNYECKECVLPRSEDQSFGKSS